MTDRQSEFRLISILRILVQDNEDILLTRIVPTPKERKVTVLTPDLENGNPAAPGIKRFYATKAGFFKKFFKVLLNRQWVVKLPNFIL